MSLWKSFSNYTSTAATALQDIYNYARPTTSVKENLELMQTSFASATEHGQNALANAKELVPDMQKVKTNVHDFVDTCFAAVVLTTTACVAGFILPFVATGTLLTIASVIPSISLTSCVILPVFATSVTTAYNSKENLEKAAKSFYVAADETIQAGGHFIQAAWKGINTMYSGGYALADNTIATVKPAIEVLAQAVTTVYDFTTKSTTVAIEELNSTDTTETSAEDKKIAATLTVTEGNTIKVNLSDLTALHQDSKVVITEKGEIAHVKEVKSDIEVSLISDSIMTEDFSGVVHVIGEDITDASC